MMRRQAFLVSVALGLVLGLALMLLSPAARADGAVPDAPAQKPTAEEFARGKKLFETALKLFNEGAYDVALASFEQSYRVAGRPSALRNVAQCHRNLHHFVEAYDVYDALLARHATELSAADKTLVTQATDELGTLTGTITVVTSPGASIEVDSHAVGKAPVKPTRVPLGPHRVTVEQEGFLPFATEISIAPGQAARVEATLKPESTTGRLAVRELHEHPVHVFVDGNDLGPAPFEGELSAGEHTLEAKSDRFSSERRTITIKKKERAEITVDAVALTGLLRVTATVNGGVAQVAQITLDGKLVAAGSYQAEVNDGPHTLSIAAPGYVTVTRPLTIERGQTLAVDVPLASNTPARGTQPEDFRGVYVRLNVEGAINPAGMPDNGAAPVTQASHDPGLGIGGTARVGYSFHWLAAEVVGTFLGAFGSQDLQLSSQNPSTNTQHYTIRQDFNANGFIGAGARATSRDESFRFTVGLAPGVAVRSFKAHIENNGGGGGSCLGAGDPSCGGSSGGEGSGVGYTTFGLRADAGLLMGSTPGTKFFLGLQSWVDFPPRTLAVGPDTGSSIPNNGFAAPGRGIYVVSGGPQFFIGPQVGIQFGR